MCSLPGNQAKIRHFSHFFITFFHPPDKPDFINNGTPIQGVPLFILSNIFPAAAMNNELFQRGYIIQVQVLKCYIYDLQLFV